MLAAFGQAGSVKEAADLLGSSGSTVCRHIKETEDDLNVRLFKRERNGMWPTAVGRRVLEIAGALATEVAGLRRIVADDARPGGTVVVSLPDIVASSALPAISELTRNQPDVTVSLACASAEPTSYPADVDCAVVIARSPPEHWVGRPAANFAVAVYAHAELQQEAERDIRPLGWVDWELPLASARPCGLWHELSAGLAVRGKCDSVIAQQQALRAELGVGPLPCAVGELDPLLRRVRTLPTVVVGKVWVLIHPDVRSLWRVREMYRLLTEALQRDGHVFSGESPAPTQPTF